jgi:uncharacterized membrane protein
MALFNIFGKKDSGSELMKGLPFKLVSEWTPYRLYSGKRSSSSLSMRVKNMTKETLLTSVVIQLPDQLSFDEIGVSKEKEMRLGELAPGEEKELRAEVFNNLRADPGEYTVSLTAIAHYRDYGHVLNAIKKKALINVV